jgi:hypothetical protein
LSFKLGFGLFGQVLDVVVAFIRQLEILRAQVDDNLREMRIIEVSLPPQEIASKYGQHTLYLACRVDSPDVVSDFWLRDSSSNQL